MGLDAVVYRNRKHLKLESDDGAARLVSETGEVYFEDDELSRKYRLQFRTAEHRLGNMAEISALRDEVTRLIGPDSVILRKVLYSGTHSGDIIPVESVSTLIDELNSIHCARQQSPELKRFVGSMKEIIQAAEDEGNPIVFV